MLHNPVPLVFCLEGSALIQVNRWLEPIDRYDVSVFLFQQG